MSAPGLLAFVVTSALVIATPGQDTALVVRSTLVAGRAAGTAVALGVAAGQLVWTAAAAVGAIALLQGSDWAFAGLRLAGAAYLAALGLAAVWRALRDRGPGPAHTSAATATPAATAAARRPRGRWFAQGLLSNLANPKMGLFFAGLLPQFASPDAAVLSWLGLGAAFSLMTVAWLSVYAVVLDRARARVLAGRARRVLEAVTGLVLVALAGHVLARGES